MPEEWPGPETPHVEVINVHRSIYPECGLCFCITDSCFCRAPSVQLFLNVRATNFSAFFTNIVVGCTHNHASGSSQ